MKILIVDYNLGNGGIETSQINFLERINHDQYKIDFLIYKTGKALHEDKVKKNGSNVFRVTPPEKVSRLKHILEIRKIIKRGHYDVVHSNTNFDSGMVLLAAWTCGVKLRIAHCHTTIKDYKNLKQKFEWFIGKRLATIFSNRRIACGIAAGKNMFGKKDFKVLHNVIDIEKFKFNSSMRKTLRRQYGLDKDTIAIGYIGRFVPGKNHEFAVEVFENILKSGAKAKLFFVGDGERKNLIEELAHSKKINDDIIFTGDIQNVNDYYNLMDVIIFPSLHEGFPLVFVEAQINGLKIIANANIPHETNLIDNVEFLKLDSNIILWVKAIIRGSKNRHFDYSYFLESDFNLDSIEENYTSIYNINKV